MNSGSLGADQVTLVDFAPGRPNVRGLLRGQQTGAKPMPVNHRSYRHRTRPRLVRALGRNRTRKSFLGHHRKRAPSGDGGRVT